MQQDSQIQEFTAPDVHLAVHRKPACHVEYHVSLGSRFLKEAKTEAAKRVRKQVSLPGFRKGKVPEELIIKNYPKEVEKETLGILANQAWKESDKLAHVPLLHRDSKVSYQIKNRTEESIEFVLSFETEPLIPHVDPKDFHLEQVPRPEIDKVKIDEMIRQTRLFFASWGNITDRPAQEGDFVLLDVDDIETTPATKVFSRVRFEVADTAMAAWMKAAVIGMRAGESKEAVSVADPNLPEEERAAFPDKRVRIELFAIENPTMPELNEAFAQSLGITTTPEEAAKDIEAAIERILNQQADAYVMEKNREQAATFLLTHYPFDLPPSLIEKEASFRLSQLFRDPAFKSHWDALSTEERKNLAKSLYEQSDKAVRLFYLCRQLLDDAHVDISPQRLAQRPQNMLETLFNQQGHGQENLPHEVQQAEAYARLLLEEAQHYLIEKARSKHQDKG